MAEIRKVVLGPRLTEGKMYSQYLREEERKLEAIRKARLEAARQAMADRKTAGIDIRLPKNKMNPHQFRP